MSRLGATQHHLPPKTHCPAATYSLLPPDIQFLGCTRRTKTTQFPDWISIPDSPGLGGLPEGLEIFALCLNAQAMKSSLLISLNIYSCLLMCVCIHLCVSMYAQLVCVHMTLNTQHMWRSEDNLWELAVSCHVVSWD